MYKRGDAILATVWGRHYVGVVIKDFGKKVRIKIDLGNGVRDVPIVDKKYVAPADIVGLDAAAA